jgi:Glucodextranase, domain B
MNEIKNKSIKWWLGVASCTALFLVIGIFSYMKMAFVLNGVQINANIEHGDGTSLAVVSGKAPNANFISLNGREIFIDKDGSFSEKVALIPGFSVITIDATDKFGNSKEKEFQLVYKEGSPLVAFLK